MPTTLCRHFQECTRNAISTAVRIPTECPTPKLASAHGLRPIGPHDKEKPVKLAYWKNFPHLLVAVLHARDQLPEEIARLGLGQPPALDDAVEQFSARCVLHGDGQVIGRQKHLRGARRGGREGLAGQGR